VEPYDPVVSQPIRLLIFGDGVTHEYRLFLERKLYKNVIAIGSNMVMRCRSDFSPGSVMYGSDALGGVMEIFIPLDPSFSTIGQATNRRKFISRYIPQIMSVAYMANSSYGF